MAVKEKKTIFSLEEELIPISSPQIWMHPIKDHKFHPRELAIVEGSHMSSKWKVGEASLHTPDMLGHSSAKLNLGFPHRIIYSHIALNTPHHMFYSWRNVEP